MVVFSESKISMKYNKNLTSECTCITVSTIKKAFSKKAWNHYYYYLNLKKIHFKNKSQKVPDWACTCDK